MRRLQTWGRAEVLAQLATPPKGVTGPAGNTASAPGLDDRQAAVLVAIKAHIVEHGQPPTLRDIAAACGLACADTAAYAVGALEAKGFIRRTSRQTRAIAVIGDPCWLCSGTGVS
jgi:repressor LexA